MENKENIQAAIKVLTEANDKVYVLLASFPALQIRCKNAISTLVGGLSHTIQVPLPTATGQPFEPEPLTHIFGQKVSRDVKSVGPAKVDVSEADVEELRERVIVAYETFLERDNKSLIDSLTDMEIRGVAKLAGLEVSATEPKKITSPFVDKIKKAITVKEEQAEAEADAEKITQAKTTAEAEDKEVSATEPKTTTVEKPKP